MSEITLSSRGLPGLALGGRVASDERLARLVARGNARAFAVLYERHHAALHRYCRSIVRDEEDARDALQSALTRAFAALQASERDVAVRPWLFRIVHNEAISLLRRRAATEPMDEQAPAGVSLAGLVEERERFATLVADLRSLPERQRAALVMRELSGLSIEEIAAALSTSRGAAKQTLFEARCALHELAEGRAMECETVRETLSERDGRVLRARRLRAHLRACAGCREFRELIDARSADLRALVPPLPAVTAAGLLARLLAHGSGSGAGAGAAASLGAPATASLAAKALAGGAIAMVAATGTAAIVVRDQGHVPERAVALAPSAYAAARRAPAALAPTSLSPAGGSAGTARRSPRRGAGSDLGATPDRQAVSRGTTGATTRGGRTHTDARPPAAGGARQQGSHRHDPPAAGHEAAPRGRGRSGSAPSASSKRGHHATPSPPNGPPAQPAPPATPPSGTPANPSPGASGAAPAHANGDHPPPGGHRH